MIKVKFIRPCLVCGEKFSSNRIDHATCGHIHNFKSYYEIGDKKIARDCKRISCTEVHYRKITVTNSLVHAALKEGKLKKEPCYCGTTTHVVAHHEDYEKPYDVLWLCKKHHKARHRFLILRSVDFI